MLNELFIVDTKSSPASVSQFFKNSFVECQSAEDAKCLKGALSCVWSELLAEAREVYLSEPSTQLTEVRLIFSHCQEPIARCLQAKSCQCYFRSLRMTQVEQLTS